MQKLTFRLPRLGGAESEAKVLVWKKAAGEAFREGDTLLEVETDKAVVDVPAPADGVLLEQLVAVDAYAEFDVALAEIELADADAAAYGTSTGAESHKRGSTAAAPEAAEMPAGSAGPLAHTGRVLATPVARKLAAEAGLALGAIRGTGPGGRIVRNDVSRLASVGVGARVGAAPAADDLRVSTREGEVFVRRWNHASPRSAAVTTVLIHGLFGDVDTWSGLATILAERGESLLALDLPAHGRTTAVARSLDEMARVVAQVLIELVPGPKVLVGHSLGGALAVKLAQIPAVQCVRALALIAPAGFGTEINQGFVHGMLYASTPALFRRELEKLAQRLPALGDALVAQLHGSVRSRGAALAGLVEGFAVHGVQQVDLRAELDALQMPVSLLWGRLDQVIPWSHALNATPRAALHLFPDAGHMPQWESSNVVAELLRRVVRGAGQGSGS